MAAPVLSAKLRNVNKGDTLTKIRKSGKVPGVVYSRAENTKEILLDSKEIQKILSKYGPSTKIGLEIEGEKKFSVIKEIQREIMKNELLHMDFQTLDENEKIKMVMPIHIYNREKVETSDQVVQQNINEVEIQTYPRYLPEKIEIDAMKLKDKDSITVEDLDVFRNENIEVMENSDNIIASLVHTTGMTQIEEPAEDTQIL